MGKNTKKIGRPRKKVKEINPPRMIGRWDADSWQLIRSAAASADTGIAGWARPILIRAAKRQLAQTGSRGEDTGDVK